MAALSGTVKDAYGAFAQKLVRVFKRDTGVLVGQTLSNATTGAWSITTADTSEHFALVHDTNIADIYWPQTVLACHFNGTNGSTTFTDEKGHILTAYGNTQISTAQSKFGGAAAYFDGAGDYLTAPSGADFQLGTGDFTVETWVYITGAPQANQVIISLNTYPNTTGFFVGYTGTNIAVSRGNAGALITRTQPANNTWFHLAVVRAGGNLNMYLNGVGVTPVAFTNNISDGVCWIGRPSDIANYMMQGYLDDLRITKGVARYTADFTPPTSAFIDGISGGTENAVILDRLVPV